MKLGTNTLGTFSPNDFTFRLLDFRFPRLSWIGPIVADGNTAGHEIVSVSSPFQESYITFKSRRKEAEREICFHFYCI
jgi:hypothetical protein